MKDILFRALTTDNKWVYGYPTGTEWFLAFDEKNDFEDIEKVVIQPLTICQYIGVTDDDGKHIFENDIVIEPNDRTKQTYFITYDDFHAAYRKSASLKNTGNSALKGRFKVIGNIIENKDLFKEPTYQTNLDVDSTPTSDRAFKKFHERTMKSIGK